MNMGSRTSPQFSAMRSPKRLSITVPNAVMQRLLECSDEQGRSTSNLAAYLLEQALDALDDGPQNPKRWPGPQR